MQLLILQLRSRLATRPVSDWGVTEEEVDGEKVDEEEVNGREGG